MKDFTLHPEAFELKQLGFDEPCFTYYKNDQLSDILELVKNSEMTNVNNESDDYISAPTYSQAFRWFREKHNLKSCIMFRTSMADNEEYYDWLIKGQEVVYRHFKTYEEAELACLKKLIEIVKGLESQ
jgi:dolichyl-phosphate-mannose--protein O-mannosyl transferase